MSKECKGKYHGAGIKIIDDDEEYCTICQQNIDLKNKQKKEKIGTFFLVLIGASAIVKKILKNKNKKNEKK